VRTEVASIHQHVSAYGLKEGSEFQSCWYELDERNGRMLEGERNFISESTLI